MKYRTFFKFMPFFSVFFLLFPAVTQGASGPAVSYAYPAGGSRGTTFHVLLGGRQIFNAQSAEITGEGVSVRILKGFKQMAMNTPDTREPAMALYLEEASVLQAPPEQREARRAEMLKARAARLCDPARTEDVKAWQTPEQLADNFVYFDVFLRNPTPEEMQTVYWEYFLERPDRKPKETLNQGVLLEVVISPDAPCGTRWLTLEMPYAKTEPVPFCVGAIPEVKELEPNDEAELPKRWNRETRSMETWAYSLQEPAKLPVVFNGQVRPGDVDRFRFEAKKGEKLVLSVVGRALSPFLADAVPGWFQPLLTLYAPDGTELGGASCYRNDPDPVLFLDAPQDGVYSVEIRDSLFRGRDDFVYRLTVGAIPWTSAVYPPCVQAGKPFSTHLEGVNLPENSQEFHVENPVGTPNSDGVSTAEITELNGIPLIHPVRYSVEAELPCEAAPLQDVTLPCVFYGRLAEAGQKAEFRFHAKKGERITAEVTAQAFDSPLDARLTLADAQGKILAANDDRAGSDGPNIGVETHHADPLLALEIPEDGVYAVHLSNTLYEKNDANIYRIRIARTEPDFLVFCQTPALMFNTATQLLDLQIVRLHGYDGPVEIVGGAPGVEVQNGLVPSGQTRALCTVTVFSEFWPRPEENPNLKRNPDGTLPEPGKIVTEKPLPILARSVGVEPVVERPISSAVKREQAFIYFHYLPAGPVTGQFRGPQKLEYAPVSELPVLLKRDGVTEVVYDLILPWRKGKNPERLPGKPTNKYFEISPLVPGITVESQDFDAVSQTLRLRVADPEQVPKEGVLLFEMYWKKEDEDSPQNKGSILGWLPAVPYRLAD